MYITNINTNNISNLKKYQKIEHSKWQRKVCGEILNEAKEKQLSMSGRFIYSDNELTGTIERTSLYNVPCTMLHCQCTPTQDTSLVAIRCQQEFPQSIDHSNERLLSIMDVPFWWIPQKVNPFIELIRMHRYDTAVQLAVNLST